MHFGKSHYGEIFGITIRRGISKAKLQMVIFIKGKEYGRQRYFSPDGWTENGKHAIIAYIMKRCVAAYGYGEDHCNSEKIQGRIPGAAERL